MKEYTGIQVFKYYGIYYDIDINGKVGKLVDPPTNPEFADFLRKALYGVKSGEVKCYSPYINGEECSETCGFDFLNNFVRVIFDRPYTEGITIFGKGVETGFGNFKSCIEEMLDDHKFHRNPSVHKSSKEVREKAIDVMSRVLHDLERL